MTQHHVYTTRARAYNTCSLDTYMTGSIAAHLPATLMRIVNTTPPSILEDTACLCVKTGCAVRNILSSYPLTDASILHIDWVACGGLLYFHANLSPALMFPLCTGGYPTMHGCQHQAADVHEWAIDRFTLVSKLQPHSNTDSSNLTAFPEGAEPIWVSYEPPKEDALVASSTFDYEDSYVP